jgi:MFS superfamily sulfate permease-like transporter
MSTKLEDRYVEAKAAAKLYAETEADLIKLKLVKGTTRYIGKFIATTLTILLGFVSLIILLMALGFALAEYFQSASLGFLCSGGIGLFITLLASMLLRKILNRSIIQGILKELYDAS